MKKVILVFALLLSLSAGAQELYIKTFGQATDKPILFLHGGPGYNAAGFEISTAETLSRQGFFVMVYDRRGEGRSVDPAAKFNFEQTFADIDQICQTHKIQKINLMGHSFGGMLAVLYAEKHPEKVDAVLLVSAPVALQESFQTILDASRKKYEVANDQTNLKYLGMIAQMDTASLEYMSYTFMHAMQNGFYSPKVPTDQAKEIYQKMAGNPDFKFVREMTREAPTGFWKNEHYSTMDLTENIRNLSKKVKVFGIYGQEDGLYSARQIEKLSTIIGKDQLIYLDQASHNVFIDRQQPFLLAVKKYLQ